MKTTCTDAMATTAVKISTRFAEVNIARAEEKIKENISTKTKRNICESMKKRAKMEAVGRAEDIMMEKIAMTRRMNVSS